VKRFSEKKLKNLLWRGLIALGLPASAHMKKTGNVSFGGSSLKMRLEKNEGLSETFFTSPRIDP